MMVISKENRERIATRWNEATPMMKMMIAATVITTFGGAVSVVPHVVQDIEPYWYASRSFVREAISQHSATNALRFREEIAKINERVVLGESARELIFDVQSKTRRAIIQGQRDFWDDKLHDAPKDDPRIPFYRGKIRDADRRLQDILEDADKFKKLNGAR